MKRRNKALLAAGLAASLMLALLAGCSPQNTTPNPVPVIDGDTGAVTSAVPAITVTGTGELSLEPDMANIQFGVNIRNKPTASEAMDAAAAIMDALQNVLLDMGVSKEDMQTSNFSIHEEQKYDGNGNITGKSTFAVSNSLSVNIYDIDNIGGYLDAAVNAGATNTYGITFSIQDRSKYENDALALALQNAKSRAEALATAAGKSLGELLQITDGTPVIIQNETYREMAMADTAKSAGTPISPGSITISANVNVRYILK